MWGWAWLTWLTTGRLLPIKRLSSHNKNLWPANRGGILNFMRWTLRRLKGPYHITNYTSTKKSKNEIPQRTILPLNMISGLLCHYKPDTGRPIYNSVPYNSYSISPAGPQVINVLPNSQLPARSCGFRGLQEPFSCRQLLAIFFLLMWRCHY